MNEHGQKAMVSQNRNVQYFKEPTYLLPVTYEHGFGKTPEIVNNDNPPNPEETLPEDRKAIFAIKAI